MLKNCPDSNNWVIQAPVLHNKRASYSPAGAVTGTHSHNHGGVGGGHHHGPQSSDFLFGAPRFQERYRSNSMDSILVEQERHARQPVFVQVSSHQKFWESILVSTYSVAGKTGRFASTAWHVARRTRAPCQETDL